jgi:hypothetical protein
VRRNGCPDAALHGTAQVSPHRNVWPIADLATWGQWEMGKGKWQIGNRSVQSDPEWPFPFPLSYFPLPISHLAFPIWHSSNMSGMS